MDPETFASGSFFKWDPRGLMAPTPARLVEAVAAVPQPQTVAVAAAAAFMGRPRELGGIEELFQAYGIRYYTAAKIAELGFTVNTLLGMKEEELDEMMNSVSQIFRWELLVGERYGIKAAVRAERRRLEEEDSRRRHLVLVDRVIRGASAARERGGGERRRGNVGDGNRWRKEEAAAAEERAEKGG
ncbi:hypothetical protein GOBAR_DD34419 [Gossypium barbadense]|nr:hypothetical protein GOBAR_DD34419 [Gossypium barbadense]